MDLYQFFDGHYSITEVLNHSQKINTASTNSNVCFTKKVLVLWDQSWQWFIKWLYKLYVRFKPRIIDNKTNKQHTWHGGRVFLGTRRKCIRSQKTSIDQVISSDTMPSSTEDVIATTAFLFFLGVQNRSQVWSLRMLDAVCVYSVERGQRNVKVEEALVRYSWMVSANLT